MNMISPASVDMKLGTFLGMFIRDPDRISDIYRDLRRSGLATFTTKVEPNQASKLTVTNRRYQRAVRPNHVNKLAKAMIASQYEPGSFTIGVVKADQTNMADTIISIQDGQHRIDAIRKSETAQPTIFVVRAFDDEESMKHAALRTDAHQKRSGSDQAQIMEIDLGPQLFKEDVKCVVPAIDDIMKWRVVGHLPLQTAVSGMISGDNRVAVYNHLRNEIVFYFNTINYGTRFYDHRCTKLNNGRTQHLRWNPFVTMGIGMFRKNAAVAEQFWRAIATGTAQPGTPEAALYEFILGRSYHDEDEKGTGGNDQKRAALGAKIAWEYKLGGKKLQCLHLTNRTHKEFKDKANPYSLALV